MPRLTLASLGFAAAAAIGLGQSAAAGERPVVVELFTSQGCSSCPPANAALIRLAQRPDVIALSYSVTYWDRLGWKDVFGRPEFDERQAIYEPALGERSSFTPQMVVNGRLSAVGSREAQVRSQIEQAADDRGPDVEIASGKVRIGAGAAPAGGADVWAVRFDPRVQSVAVARGENARRTLPHGNVVRDIVRIGSWTGAALALDLPAAGDGLKTAVLVQTRRGGPIVGAAVR